MDEIAEIISKSIPILVLVAFVLWRVLRFIKIKGKLEKVLDEGNYQLVDVRSPSEFATHSVPSSLNIPVDQISGQYELLNKNRPIIVYCASGGRSAMAKIQLKKLGFHNVINAGGIRTVLSLLNKVSS